MITRCILALSVALGLGACSGQNDRVMVQESGSTGSAAATGGTLSDTGGVAFTSETEIEEEVREELGDEGLDATAIEVRVQGSSVWLSGRVASAEEVERARRVSEDVEGVAAVDVTGLSLEP